MKSISQSVYYKQIHKAANITCREQTVGGVWARPTWPPPCPPSWWSSPGSSPGSRSSGTRDPDQSEQSIDSVDQSEARYLIPLRGVAHRVVIADEHLLVPLDVPQRHHGHYPAKPRVLELPEGRVLHLEAVTGLVAQGGAVLVAGLGLGTNVQVHWLVQGQPGEFFVHQK